MADCPKCGTQLTEDFGMVTCPGCGAFLFIDMDGVAQMAAAEPAPVADMNTSNTAFNTGLAELSNDTKAPTEHNPFPGFTPEVIEPEAAPMSNTDVASDAAFLNDGDLPPFEIPGAFGEPVAAPATADEEPAEFAASFESALSEDAPESEPESSAVSASEDFSMDNFLGLGEPVESTGSNEPTPEDPLGLNEFSNSELSLAKDGLLMYRVFVSGIDSKEIRESIREALQDSRFAWNPSRMMASVSKGVLRIEQLTPVKASIFISRIKRLPVKIRWEQYAITQSEPESP